MLRLLLFAPALLIALMFVTAPVAAQDFSGTLEEGDEVRDNGAYYDAYEFEAVADDEVRVRMTAPSEDFDTYLLVYGPNGEEYYNDDYQNDEYAATAVSQVEFTAPASGTYTVWASAYAGEATGAYEVEVSTTAYTVAEEMSGRLDPDDEQAIKGEYFDSMSVKAPTSGPFYVELRALGFDGYLRVVGPDGQTWRNDDFGDSAGYRISRVGPLEGDGGTWQVDVTSYGAEEVGAYDVRVLTPSE